MAKLYIFPKKVIIIQRLEFIHSAEQETPARQDSLPMREPIFRDWQDVKQHSS